MRLETKFCTTAICKIANRHYGTLKLLPVAEWLAAASFLLDSGFREAIW